ncbi:MAG: NAD(P)/FAD-dependent oxidoreductase [Thermoleophilaceae bacterium]|nr:NAD(P)/FAD-dependent oxidoreductase [Thermoleophilaceae bacterium]
MAWHVVIAGGGFGGLYAARRLEHVLPPESARITLVSDTNFLLYTPLLPGAASGTLEPRHVVVPLRSELHRTDIRFGWVTGADPALSELRYRTLDGRSETLRYDHLIVALGSVSRVLPIPGLADHGLGFKTISEAIALRNRVLVNLEVAEASESPEQRREYLTFVFVGAGYAGVEGIAELQDFVADVIERYPRARLEGTRWIIVEAEDRIMPEIDPGLADFATRELQARGIEVRTGTRVSAVEENSVQLSTGERIPCRTVCWTAGVKPPAIVRELGLPLTERGRIDVDATMRVRGHRNVWAIGDAAAVPDPAARGTRPSPPTAQHAIRQGRRVAENVAATLGKGRVRPFRYRTLGVFVDMGRHKAVAQMFGLKLRGFPAWWAARTYHLAMMPGASRRLRLLIDWTVALLFERDSAELGQLGHPPSLRGFLETPGESGAPPAEAARAQAGPRGP